MDDLSLYGHDVSISLESILLLLNGKRREVDYRITWFKSQIFK